MLIREYQPSDCRQLAELFYDTVHRVNAKDYTKEQLDVWATGQIDLEKWNRSFQEHFSYAKWLHELIRLRNRYARTAGFENYLDYRYALWGLVRMCLPKPPPGSAKRKMVRESGRTEGRESPGRAGAAGGIPGGRTVNRGRLPGSMAAFPDRAAAAAECEEIST